MNGPGVPRIELSAGSSAARIVNGGWQLSRGHRRERIDPDAAVADLTRLVDAGLLVFVEIDLLRTSPGAFRDFRREAMKLSELLECHLVSGNFDYLLKARVKDMQEYRNLLGEKILALPGVSDSRSYVVMEEVKESTVLPVI